MTDTFVAYLLYVAITVPLVVYVARTLHRHGSLFLREVFAGRESLADAVNHLLVVGFYLLNLGYVALFLRTDTEIAGAAEVTELVSRKVGVVAIILGTVHLANVFVFNRFRRNAELHHAPELPVQPDAWTTVAEQR